MAVAPVPTRFVPCCTCGTGVVVTVKEPEDVATPVVVVTVIGPVVEPGIRKKVTELEVLERMSWVTAPIVTEVTLLIFVPETVIIVPGAPLVGLKDVTVSAPVEIFAVPHGVVTLALRIVPPNGMVTLICVELMTVKEEFTPFSLTWLTPMKFAPVRVIVVPIDPEIGETLDREAASLTVTMLVVLSAQLKALVTVTE